MSKSEGKIILSEGVGRSEEVSLALEAGREKWKMWCYVLKAKKEQKHRHSIRIESKGQKTAEDGVSTAG